MKGFVIAIGLAAGVLSGCSSSEAPPPRDLGVACALRDCECRLAGRAKEEEPETVELLWRANGDAYCPERYTLALVEEESPIPESNIQYPAPEPRFKSFF